MAGTDDPSEDQVWYGVRLIFRLLSGGKPSTSYEERVTLWRAKSPKEAIALAENEAAEYADADAAMFEYLHLAQVFHTFIPDRPIGSGDEVFSLLRDSDLEPDEYIDRYFSTGSEHEEQHVDS